MKGVEMRRIVVVGAVLAAAALVAGATAHAAVGTSFPAGFAVPVDASLGTPVLGFGGAGPAERAPVVLLHGNNDTPFPTACNPYGAVSQLGSYLLTRGYAPGEVWALGYQGDQCDLLADQTRRSAEAHTTLANVADLRAFVHAVLDYTGARRVDIVGHSLGGVLAMSAASLRHDIVASVITLGSPFRGIRSHPVVIEMSKIVRHRIREARGSETKPGCFTGYCDCDAVNALQIPCPHPIPHTAVYTKTDGVVDWRVCVNNNPATDVEVQSTHIGLAFSPWAYEVIANRLSQASKASWLI